MRAISVLVGNPKPHSRTGRLAMQTALALRSALGRAGPPLGPPRLIDLADLTADLLGHGTGEGGLDEVLNTVRTPGGLLLVASPTFKGAYTGLLKLFMDLLPQGGLRGVVAIPMMTAASARHGGVADSMLRPLLVEVGATVPAPALSVLEAEFDSMEEKLDRWLAQAVPALRTRPPENRDPLAPDRPALREA